jgi:O-antigen ligase
MLTAQTQKKKTVAAKSNAASVPAFSSVDFIPATLLILYLCAELVPIMGSTDVMGPQWVFISLVNLASVSYIAVAKSTASTVQHFFKAGLPWLYAVLFLLAGISIFAAINQTESIVVYARFANSVLAFCCMGILLYNRLHLLKWAAWFMSVVLFFQCVALLQEFFSKYGDQRLDSIIYNLKGNAGNKNIFAASMVIKTPFLLYLIYSSKNTVSQVVQLIALFLGTLSIFILNARSSYLGLAGVFILFIAYYFLADKETWTKKIQQFALVIVPVVLALIMSQLIIKNALRLDENSTYGTVAERLTSIDLSNEGSDNRVTQWKSAFNYIQQHPLLGSGYGNWKLASIPYERETINDFLVTYHVHNDFIETTAETGLLGGLLLLSLFVVALWYTTKIFRTGSVQSKQIAAFAFMGLGAYFVDATFNFPAERPVMQMYFALVLALITNSFLSTKTEEKTTRPVTKNGFAAIAFLIVLPALYVTYITNKSMIAQSIVNKDIQLPKQETKWADIENKFPGIPNLNVYCFPIDVFNAFYLMNDKQFDKALAYLDKSKGIAPGLSIDDNIRANIYMQLNKPDSAFIYAKKAFAARPRAASNFSILANASVALKDSNTLKTAYKEYIHYRNEAWPRKHFITSMSKLQAPGAELYEWVQESL